MTAAADSDAIFDRGEAEPDWFIEHVLNSPLWARQREIVDAVWNHRYVAVPACHGPGKTYVAAAIAVAFLFTKTESRVITTAPTGRQVEELLWGEIHKAVARAEVPVGAHLTNTRLEIDKGWDALGFTARDYDPQHFQGFHAPHILIIVDEACGVTRPIMEQIVSLMTGSDPHLLLIGNPVEAGTYFEDACSDPKYQVLPISAYDTPNFTAFGIGEREIANGTWEGLASRGPLPFPDLVTPQWVAERYAEWGPESHRYASRVLGQFPQVAEGSYYGALMAAAERERRVCELPIDPRLPVYTAWDIGVSDDTAIGFVQRVDNWLHWVDYVEGRGLGLSHYAQQLQSRGYLYGGHIGPPDIAAREFGSGVSRIAVASDLGIHFTVLKQSQGKVKSWLHEGIDAVRGILPRSKFDENRCGALVEHLKSYKRRRNPRTQLFLDDPEHDEHSHGADMVRYMALGLPLLGSPGAARKRRQPDRRWIT